MTGVKDESRNYKCESSRHLLPNSCSFYIFCCCLELKKSTISQENVLERVEKTYFFSFDTTGTNISAQILPNKHHRVDKKNLMIVLNANNMIFINI